MLESYLEYWRLMLRIDSASDSEVRGFLDRHRGGALAEQLRTNWLKVLGKRGRWELYRSVQAGFSSDDPEIACYGLLARWHTGDEVSVAELSPFWNAPRELPDGCASLAKALVQVSRLGPRDVWARFRILIDADLHKSAHRLMAWLPRDQALDPGVIRTVTRAPAKYLKSVRFDLSKVSERELVIVALTEVADEDPLAAAGFWRGKLSESFPLEDRGYVWRMLAMQGARRHLPEALEWFVQANDVAPSDLQLAWRARIALRQEKWPEVRAAIERMSSLARNDPAWTYWMGRAERALGNPLEAEGYFSRIATQYNFYGRLAAEELGIALQLPPRAEPPSEEEIAAVAAIPELARAVALYRADLRNEGFREWVVGVRGMDDRRLLSAAELARRNQMWDRAINTADRTVAAHDFFVRYPAPYREVLVQQARTNALDESWVLGLVRQESRFIANAKSPVGATGLMQVMRNTAKWVAKRARLRHFSWAEASRPEVNAMLGTLYLRYVLDNLGGSPVLASAAYNAGPTRARQWRDVRPIEGAIFAETIPFGETRDYVKKVMMNTVYYSAVLGGEALPLKTRLGMVPSRGGAAEKEIEAIP